uniref:Uncharacterized protein n=1 Tax=Oryza sativa subsp. japonica TaxID=39947 RepID=Q8H369_ORYSJ|nr:hypothetical protein [Oryza sativa Japonica Group]
MEGERRKERRKKEERRKKKKKKKKGKELWLVVAAAPVPFAMHASSPSFNAANSCWQLRPLCVDITAPSTSFGLEGVDVKNTHWRGLLYSSAGPKICLQVQGVLVSLILQPTRNKESKVKSINDSRSAGLPMTYHLAPSRCNAGQIGNENIFKLSDWDRSGSVPRQYKLLALKSALE